MEKFRAHNYGMGRKIETKVFEANSLGQAVLMCDKMFKGHHGLPGTVQAAASKSKVIGIERVVG